MADGPIIVTGGEGFVGKWLVAELRRAAVDRLIVSTTTDPEVGPELRHLEITDSDAVVALVAELQPSVIIHLAAMSFVPAAEKNPREAYSVNLMGTLNVADAVMKHAPHCRFIFVSSAEVYGGSFRRSTEPLNEAAPLDPMNIYAATKAAADTMVGQLASSGLQSIRFRPFNHFGPGQSARFVLPDFIGQIVAAERRGAAAVMKVGNLDAYRDFLDVRDVVSAYTAAALLPEPLPAGTVLNLASGVPRRIGDILNILIAKARVPIRLEPDSSRLRKSETPFAVGDASETRRLLGWSPRVPFEAALDEMFEVERAKA